MAYPGHPVCGGGIVSADILQEEVRRQTEASEED